MTDDHFPGFPHAHLRKSLSSAMTPGRRFQPERFFSCWFTAAGPPTYFLFRKNLSVTNLQCAELLALIRKCTSVAGQPDQRPERLQFASRSDFLSSLSSLLGSFEAPSKGLAERMRRFLADNYAGLLWRTVVFDQYFGSVVLYLPPHLEIDLRAVCGLSGYIHSCGPLIYSKSAHQARVQDLMASLKAYLVSGAKDLQRAYFAVYAHEETTPHDRHHQDDLRGGLDDVKILLEKYFFGAVPLVQVLSRLSNRLSAYLEVSGSDDFRKSFDEFRKSHPDLPPRTIFMISDRRVAIGCPSPLPDNERKYFCYEQLFLNENPFAIFDESKPAWIAPITLPQTLAAALINLSAPEWPRERRVDICDPFAGTGCSLLESSKFPSVKCHASDISKASAAATLDNLKFFTLSVKDLGDLAASFRDFWDHIQKPHLKAPDVADHEPEQSEHLYNEILESVDEIFSGTAALKGTSDEKVLELLPSGPLFKRILYYLAIRAVRRNVVSLRRHARDWQGVFSEEIRRFRTQLADLIELRKREHRVSVPTTGLEEFEGRYSKSVGVTSHAVRDNLKALSGDPEGMLIRDACDLEPASHDVIITDPPYGFNTEEDWFELAELYRRALRSMIGALRSPGQLLLCLPDASYTGRKSPAFTHKEIVAQQVLTVAEDLGKEVIHIAQSVPSPERLYRPPYYWEAARSLRRAILHFTFRDSAKRAGRYQA